MIIINTNKRAIVKNLIKLKKVPKNNFSILYITDEYLDLDFFRNVQ